MSLSKHAHCCRLAQQTKLPMPPVELDVKFATATINGSWCFCCISLVLSTSFMQDPSFTSSQSSVCNLEDRQGQEVARVHGHVHR